MNGVIILCKKKPHYAAAAFNLALSIKYYSPDIHITLVSDGIHAKTFSANHYSVFNLIKECSESSIAESKLSINKYSFADCNLYIDADSICVQDIVPLFDKLKGCSFKSNVIDNYTQWTDKETFEDFFKCPQGATINSSWIYFEKSKVFTQSKKFFSKGFKVDKLNQKWGGVLPDEMFFNAAISKTGTDAKIDFDLMFFDDKKDLRTPSQLQEDYYFVTFYGNRNNTRISLQEWYDRMMFKICESKGIEHRFKLGDIMAHKLVNDK